MANTAKTRIEAALDNIRNGKIIIVCDNPNRENEGDLMVAGEFATPENINFMITHGRGLVFTAITESRMKQAGLDLMVKDNKAKFSTAFTVSIGASNGITTGISAYDRSHTITTLSRSELQPEDLVSPGHVFPVVANSGGLKERQGHTEAGVHICRLAGLQEVMVGCEIIKPDGNMARIPDIEVFAKTHGLPILFIEDLLHD